MLNSPFALALIVVLLMVLLFNEAARKLAAALLVLALTFALGMYYGRSQAPLAPASHIDWSEARR